MPFEPGVQCELCPRIDDNVRVSLSRMAQSESFARSSDTGPRTIAVRIPARIEEDDNERYLTITARAVLLSYIVVLLVFAIAWNVP